MFYLYVSLYTTWVLPKEAGRGCLKVACDRLEEQLHSLEPSLQHRQKSLTYSVRCPNGA